MRIAVIADTHDHFPAALPARLQGATEIWHLGDVTLPRHLQPLERLGVPIRVVHGNCDAHPAWPHSLTLERGRGRFHLVHIPPLRAPKGAHAVLHGHTHVPRDETDPLGVRWLNPGSVSRPRHGAPAGFAWIEVDPAGAWTWRGEPW